MKKILLMISAVALLASCNCEDNTNSTDADSTVVEATTEVPISIITVEDFIENQAKYIGKEVTVSGTVTHVCKHGGKKMHLVGTSDDAKLRIDADETISEFPIELEGSDVVVTFMVTEEKVDITSLDAEYAEKEEHHADDAAEEMETDHEAEMAYILLLKDSLIKSGKEYFSNFSYTAIKYEEKK